MKKKWGYPLSSVCLFVVAILLAIYPAILPAKAVSGTFTGKAKGMEGDVVVTLTIEDNKIVDVKAEGKNETPSIGGKALKQLPPEIVKTNSIKVDGVTTATVTSDAIKAAAKEALISAGLDPKDYE